MPEGNTRVSVVFTENKTPYTKGDIASVSVREADMFAKEGVAIINEDGADIPDPNKSPWPSAEEIDKMRTKADVSIVLGELDIEHDPDKMKLDELKDLAKEAVKAIEEGIGDDDDEDELE